MLGESAAFRTLKSQLDKVTKSNGRVMLTGPAGAGKEIAARYIHANSNRAYCAVCHRQFRLDRAGPHGRGAVRPRRQQGAASSRACWKRPTAASIYFDEVADMPLGTQSKILRVLVEQQFQRVGGNDKVQVDLRVISSTNRDLAAAIEAGTFREELYHRLNVVPIPVPSLEERREDIPLLAEHFIEICNKAQGLPLRKLAEDARALAANHAVARQCAAVEERGGTCSDPWRK